MLLQAKEFWQNKKSTKQNTQTKNPNPPEPQSLKDWSKEPNWLFFKGLGIDYTSCLWKVEWK